MHENQLKLLASAAVQIEIICIIPNHLKQIAREFDATLVRLITPAYQSLDQTYSRRTYGSSWTDKKVRQRQSVISTD